MRVTINGRVRDLEPGVDLAAALAAASVDPVRGIAVAVNDAVVPRGRWSATALADGDRITVIRAAPGG